MSDRQTHLSTLALHQLRYGELDGERLATAKAHLADCPTCSGRLGAQEAERRAFVAAPIPEAIRAIGRSDAPKRAWWREWAPLGFALGTALVASLVVRELRTGPASPEVVDEIRFRGELPSVEVWVKRPEGARPLRPNEAVGAGDRVQLKYDPRGASAVAIAGRDGTARIEVYTTNAPTGIGLVTAPFGLTLDDTPGAQELFVVTSDRALDEAEVKEAVRGGVEGAKVARVSLSKRESSR